MFVARSDGMLLGFDAFALPKIQLRTPG